ncbi:cytochrome P450 [Actinomadura rupiterrae]|uniref:cytochrome P450 n=1 Tax=Actinomadura rupiterrae TaxID=559627 RepID=UPI0020A619D6|nr:cytochrome P450 [Actinomadura rupiterrae]
METKTTAQQADDALIALFTPPQPANPFPLYETLQAANRVHQSAALGLWALSGYDEVTAFLRMPDTNSGPRAATVMREDWADHPSLRLYLNSMVTLDNPDHGRIRSVASKVFTPNKIKKMQPAVERLMKRFLDEIEERAAGGEPVDLVGVLAEPFPVAVISEMLGLPHADGKRFQELADDWSRVWSGLYPEEDLVRADAAVEELTGRLQETIDARRAEPRDDLMSSIVQGSEEGRLDEDELMALVAFLFTAGFAATTNLIATGVVALIEHPDELARWRADKSITASAVDELLRHTAHTAATSRITTRPVELGGTEIPEGAHVIALLGAANRDPLKYPDPHRLDLTRDDGPNLSLSAGAHYCMGGNLARIEGAELFPALIDTFSHIEIAGTPERRDIMGLTGFATLPVTLKR